MGQLASDDEILKQYLTSARTRRRRGLVACAFCVAFIVMQVWMILLQFEQARSYDEVLAALAEIDSESVQEVGIVQMATRTSLNIALAVSSSLVGVACLAVGIYVSRGTLLARALDALVRKATART